jgi:plasmid stabilization system protein ParE
MTRDLILRERFLDSLLEIEAYLSQYISAKKARKFPNDVIGFVSDIIVPNPFAFVKYESRFPENSNVRRAVFKKDYCIVYEVTDEKIEILNIYHTSRDPNEVLL